MGNNPSLHTSNDPKPPGRIIQGYNVDNFATFKGFVNNTLSNYIFIHRRPHKQGEQEEHDASYMVAYRVFIIVACIILALLTIIAVFYFVMIKWQERDLFYKALDQEIEEQVMNHNSEIDGEGKLRYHQRVCIATLRRNNLYSVTYDDPNQGHSKSRFHSLAQGRMKQLRQNNQQHRQNAAATNKRFSEPKIETIKHCSSTRKSRRFTVHDATDLSSSNSNDSSSKYESNLNTVHEQCQKSLQALTQNFATSNSFKLLRFPYDESCNNSGACTPIITLQRPTICDDYVRQSLREQEINNFSEKLPDAVQVEKTENSNSINNYIDFSSLRNSIESIYFILIISNYSLFNLKIFVIW